MRQITYEEFEKYKDTKMTFKSYYKYVFTFTGTTYDNLDVIAYVGGDMYEIYRLDVDLCPVNLEYFDEERVMIDES